MKINVIGGYVALLLISITVLGFLQMTRNDKVKKPNEITYSSAEQSIIPEPIEIIEIPATPAPKEKTVEAQKVVVPNEKVTLTQEMYSNNYILENLTTGQVILEKDSKVRVPVASLTKIMTAHILLDKVKDLNDKVKMDPNLIERLNAEGASMAGFLPNESISIKDLLYGVILPSGADASVLTAEYISGSEENFAVEMNKYAKKLGMNDTHFLNSSGLHQEGHYSTVDDLRILLNEALKNKDFYNVFTTFNYTGEPCPVLGAGYTMQSTMSQYELSINSGEIIGGKTGFTDEAALCLASIAKINGNVYMFISTGASGYSPDGPPHISDARHVYNDVAEQGLKAN